MTKDKTYLSLWASGSGSNVENLIQYFDGREDIVITQVVVSNKNALVLQRAIKYNVPSHIISKAQLNDPNYMIPLLHKDKVDMIVLAGFLWKVPSFLIQKYPQSILNVHPALLPKYGGKNMYGNNVHRAVLNSEDKESGITVHIVNEEFDKGPIILQQSFQLDKDETLESLVEKIHHLEHRWFPHAIENHINELNKQ